MKSIHLSDILAFASRHAAKLARHLRYLVAMFFAMQDPHTPLFAKISLGATLTYILLPLDSIPDMLPIGLADDIAVIASFLGSIAANHVRHTHLRQADAALARLGCAG